MGITYYVGYKSFSAKEQKTVNKYFAPYLKFIRENNYAFNLISFDDNSLFKFAEKCEAEKRYNTICGQYQHQISLEQFTTLCHILENYGNFSDEEYTVALATASACKLCAYSDITHDNDVLHHLAQYLKYCRAMNIPPKNPLTSRANILKPVWHIKLIKRNMTTNS